MLLIQSEWRHSLHRCCTICQYEFHIWGNVEENRISKIYIHVTVLRNRFLFK